MLNYIDPGTGSMLLQAVIAGLLGFVMFFKQLKNKIKNLFNKNDDEKLGENDE